MTTRLNKASRQRILFRIMQHRFNAATIAHYNDWAVFTGRVFDDVFDGEQRALMNSLPDGWLENKQYIQVQFDAHGWEQLQFNGTPGTWNTPVEFTQFAKRKPVWRPMPHVVPSVAYNARHPFAITFNALMGDRQDLIKQVKEATATVNSILNGVISIEELLLIWPEMEPFASPEINETASRLDRSLPVVQRERLNVMLDLPVETL